MCHRGFFFLFFFQRSFVLSYWWKFTLFFPSAALSVFTKIQGCVSEVESHIFVKFIRTVDISDVDTEEFRNTWFRCQWFSPSKLSINCSDISDGNAFSVSKRTLINVQLTGKLFFFKYIYIYIYIILNLLLQYFFCHFIFYLT